MKFISPVVLLDVCCISKMCVIERYKHFDPNQVCTCPLFFDTLILAKRKTIK